MVYYTFGSRFIKTKGKNIIRFWLKVHTQELIVCLMSQHSKNVRVCVCVCVCMYGSTCLRDVGITKTTLSVKKGFFMVKVTET